MKNRKGMSAIVITVIMVALVLVAIGVVWVVVQNLLDKSVSDIGTGSKCLSITVKPIAAGCTGAVCNATLKREAGGEDFVGLKLVYSNSTGSATVDVPGNMQPLETKTVTDLAGVNGASKLEVTVYFTDDLGNEQLCSQSTEFNF